MNSPSDKTTHARVRGREAVAGNTIWYLEIGPMRLRCLYRGTNSSGVSSYEVQARSEGRWGTLMKGNDPRLLLRRVVASNAAMEAIELKALRSATRAAEDAPG